MTSHFIYKNVNQSTNINKQSLISPCPLNTNTHKETNAVTIIPTKQKASPSFALCGINPSRYSQMKWPYLNTRRERDNMALSQHKDREMTWPISTRGQTDEVALSQPKDRWHGLIPTQAQRGDVALSQQKDREMTWPYPNIRTERWHGLSQHKDRPMKWPYPNKKTDDMALSQHKHREMTWPYPQTRTTSWSGLIPD